MSEQSTAIEMKPGVTWGEWLNQHGNKLLLFARQQTRSMADAEDVLQEALVKLARKVSDGVFTGGQEAWLAYVYTSIRRCSIDLGRKDSRRKLREEKAEEEHDINTGGITDPWFKSSIDGDDSREKIEIALRQLPEKFAEVIVLKIWGEMTFAEIAGAVEVSQNTVASRYRYGLDALKKILAIDHKKGDLIV